jgi:hypothetical protein
VNVSVIAGCKAGSSVKKKDVHLIITFIELLGVIEL